MVAFDEKIARCVEQQMLRLGGGTVSRHLDEMIPADLLIENDINWSLGIFSNFLKKIRENGERRTAIWIVGLSSSVEITIPDETSVTTLKTIIDLATFTNTIYLFDGKHFFIEGDEEYRKMVDTPAQYADIKAAYRSWRSDTAKRNGWEFSNDLYLWNCGDSLGSR